MDRASDVPLYQKEMRPSGCTLLSSAPVTSWRQVVHRLRARSWAGVSASEAQPPPPITEIVMIATLVKRVTVPRPALRIGPAAGPLSSR